MAQQSEVVRSAAAAEAKAIQRSLYVRRGCDADAVEAEVKERHGKMVKVASRMLTAAAELGLALIALKERSLHGTYLDRLQRLGISKSTADRCRQVAIYREMLPTAPPAELYGDMWTITAALEYGKERTTIMDMIDDSEAITDAAIDAKTVKRLQARHGGVQRSALANRVRKVIADVREAMRLGDLGVDDAIDQLSWGTELLIREQKALAGQADEDQ